MFFLAVLSIAMVVFLVWKKLKTQSWALLSEGWTTKLAAYFGKIIRNMDLSICVCVCMCVCCRSKFNFILLLLFFLRLPFKIHIGISKLEDNGCVFQCKETGEKNAEEKKNKKKIEKRKKEKKWKGGFCISEIPKWRRFNKRHQIYVFTHTHTHRYVRIFRFLLLTFSFPLFFSSSFAVLFFSDYKTRKIEIAFKV